MNEEELERLFAVPAPGGSLPNSQDSGNGNQFMNLNNDVVISKPNKPFRFNDTQSSGKESKKLDELESPLQPNARLRLPSGGNNLMASPKDVPQAPSEQAGSQRQGHPNKLIFIKKISDKKNGRQFD